MNKYFQKYTSNSITGSGNQHYFLSDPKQIRTGRIFYRITHGGRYAYSLLFSNIIDSTYSDGSVSHKNLICDAWEIHGAKVGIYRRESGEISPRNGDEVNNRVENMQDITFTGNGTKTVAPGEFFCSDPVIMEFAAGDYLCLEMTFSGRMIPYHEETLLPVYARAEGRWIYDKHMPFAGMIGCDRKAEKRIAFLGDSITQGIGTPFNSDRHWNAVVAQRMGEKYACWNLGLGYGRAADMASGGAWMFKARHNDAAVVCFGVNDIYKTRNALTLMADIRTIVETLKTSGQTVVLQTIPPFDYDEETRLIWERVNTFIREELAEKVDMLFDVVPILGTEGCLQRAKFGGHPDVRGCEAWAEALLAAMQSSGLF